MKITVNVNMAKKMFEDYNRDYFSLDGIDKILSFYDEVIPDTEFDVVGICCDCSEYGSHGAVLSFDDFISDYGYMVNRDEWLDENALKPDEWDDNKELYIEAIAERLEYYTTILKVCNGNYIVFAF